MDDSHLTHTGWSFIAFLLCLALMIGVVNQGAAVVAASRSTQEMVVVVVATSDLPPPFSVKPPAW